MVKQREKNSRKKCNDKGFRENRTDARKIKASTSTPYETYTEQLSPFGGLFASIRFLNLVKLVGLSP